MYPVNLLLDNSSLELIQKLATGGSDSIMDVDDPSKDPNKLTNESLQHVNYLKNLSNNYRTVPCKNYHGPKGCGRGTFCHFIHLSEFEGINSFIKIRNALLVKLSMSATKSKMVNKSLHFSFAFTARLSSHLGKEIPKDISQKARLAYSNKRSNVIKEISESDVKNALSNTRVGILYQYTQNFMKLRDIMEFAEKQRQLQLTPQPGSAPAQSSVKPGAIEVKNKALAARPAGPQKVVQRPLQTGGRPEMSQAAALSMMKYPLAQSKFNPGTSAVSFIKAQKLASQYPPKPGESDFGQLLVHKLSFKPSLQDGRVSSVGNFNSYIMGSNASGFAKQDGKPSTSQRK